MNLVKLGTMANILRTETTKSLNCICPMQIMHIPLMNLYIKQSGNTWFWRNSPDLGKFEKCNLGKFPRFGEMAIFIFCISEGKNIVYEL
jgi:hypothetical protein